MGEVIPDCSSSRGLLLHTCAVSYEMVRQSSVVSTVKNLSWPRPARTDMLHVGYNWCWVAAGSVSCLCLCIGSLILMVGPMASSIVVFLYYCFLFICLFIHNTVVHSVTYWYRDVPFRLIGAKAKFMIEVIPMITAATLRHLLEFSYGYPVFLLGCVTYFYIFAHFLHAAYDIRVVDALLGSTMLVLFYMVDVDLLVRALALSVCVALCFCKYLMYYAPEVPEHRKKESKQLPC